MPSVLPNHLADLLEPTPGAVIKLIAAWDGLSVKTQILVLKELGRSTGPYQLEHESGEARAFYTRLPVSGPR